MAHRVGPWWLGYFLLNPLRRFGQNPTNILSPHVREGMTVLEPGPGMGFFTLELARLVGSSGRVIAVEIQPKMLVRLKRRAAKDWPPRPAKRSVSVARFHENIGFGWLRRLHP